MRKKHLLWIIPVVGIIFLICGIGLVIEVEDEWMGEYDLYNCIRNNAERNNFNQHPVMIEKIQQECICFKENNWTNLLEADCSYNTGDKNNG